MYRLDSVDRPPTERMFASGADGTFAPPHSRAPEAALDSIDVPLESTKLSVAHLDADAFYVSVELLRHPELRGRPVVVSGSGPRAVVTTASYEARRYGVGSAMPAARARRLCPDAVFLAPDFQTYRETSRRMMERVRAHVEHVEVVGLDEAYLDLAGLHSPRAAMRRLITEIGVSCVPAASFWRPENAASGRGKVRFAFPKRTPTLNAAISRLQRLAPAAGSRG